MQYQNLYFRIFCLLFESESLKHKKLEDHRSFCGIMFFFSGVFGASLWLWDYVTDPVGSLNTIELRLGFLFLSLVALAFKFVKSRHLLISIALISIWIAEGMFVAILNRLDGGMIYGIGGFMIFAFIPLLLLQGFSLLLNLFQSIVVAGLPHILAIMGYAPGFQHDQYAVLIWPTVLMMMAIYFTSAHNYRSKRDFELALEHASHTDPMTGLYNRRYFEPLLGQEIIRCARLNHRVSLMILDIDHFKKVNDTYGHPTGDLVICLLADICKKISREIDVVARLGGEEFAIMLPETSATEAVALAERIRITAEKTMVTSLDGKKFYFTVSIGVTEQHPDELSEKKVVELADKALYQAKESGRNRVQVCHLYN